MLLNVLSEKIRSIFDLLTQYASVRRSNNIFYNGIDSLKDDGSDLYRYVELVKNNYTASASLIGLTLNDRNNSGNNSSQMEKQFELLPEGVVPLEWLVDRLEHLYMQVSNKLKERIVIGEDIHNDNWCWMTLNACGVGLERLFAIYMRIWRELIIHRKGKKEEVNKRGSVGSEAADGGIVFDVGTKNSGLWKTDEGYSHLIRLVIISLDNWRKNIPEDFRENVKSEITYFLEKVLDSLKEEGLAIDIGNNEEKFRRLCNLYVGMNEAS
jgi:hypothetical protein